MRQICRLLLIPLLSVAATINQQRFISILTWLLLYFSKRLFFFVMSSFGGISVTGDLVLRGRCCLILSFLKIFVILLDFYVKWSLFQLKDWSICLMVGVNLSRVCWVFKFFDLLWYWLFEYTSAKCPIILNLRHFVSRAGPLCLRLQFGALKTCNFFFLIFSSIVSFVSGF